MEKLSADEALSQIKETLKQKEFKKVGLLLEAVPMGAFAWVRDLFPIMYECLQANETETAKAVLIRAVEEVKLLKDLNDQAQLLVLTAGMMMRDFNEPEKAEDIIKVAFILLDRVSAKDRAPLLSDIAVYYAKAGDPVKALELSASLKESEKSNVLRECVLTYAQKGDLENAIKLFAPIKNRSMRQTISTDVQRQLGDAGRLEESLRFATRSLDEKELREAIVEIATAYRKKGMVDQALNLVTQEIPSRSGKKIKVDDPGLLAGLYGELGQREKAWPLLLQALKNVKAKMKGNAQLGTLLAEYAKAGYYERIREVLDLVGKGSHKRFVLSEISASYYGNQERARGDALKYWVEKNLKPQFGGPYREGWEERYKDAAELPPGL